MQNLTIALDVMGGDYGPRSTIPAAIEAVKKYPHLNAILCGHSQFIQSELQKLEVLNHPRLSIVHCEQVVTMDENPTHALRSKRKSSMRIALDLVAEGKADACVSSGNTGALISIAHYVLKMLPGVKRPALVTTLPTTSDEHVYLLDLGANIRCDAETLSQFAVMGSVVVQEVEQISSPKVALLNVGEEEIKGHEEIKKAAKILKRIDQLNYAGYIEGNHIFSGKANVVVCDGFVGNVALKTCEGISNLLIYKLKNHFQKQYYNKLLNFILLPLIKKLYNKLNPDQYNGASLIGLRGIVVKSHGNASSQAFLSAIDTAVKEVQRQLPDKIKGKLEQVLMAKSD